MTELRIARHHNIFLDVFHVGLIFRDHAFLKLHQPLGMGKTGRGAEDERTVKLLAQLKSRFKVIFRLRAVGRFDHRDLRRSRHHSCILLVLGAVKSRIIGNDEYKAAVDAHVGYGIQRIRRHIQSHMLHAGHGADAGKARSDRYFCGHLLIRRPLLVYIIPVLHQVFADLRTRSSRVRGRHFHSRFICSAGNGFIAQHDHFVCHIINHPFVNLSPVLPCPRNASGNWAPPDGSGSPVRAAPSGPS